MGSFVHNGQFTSGLFAAVCVITHWMQDILDPFCACPSFCLLFVLNKVAFGFSLIGQERAESGEKYWHVVGTVKI